MKNLFLKSLSAILPALAVAGCWTFGETEYPEIANTAAGAASDVALRVVGFEATVSACEAVHSYSTVYVPGCYGRRFCEPGYMATVPTVTLVPRRQATDMFLRRAQDSFERAGFLLRQENADKTVEVHFEGPFTSSGEEMQRLAWEVFTVFFCDYGAATWTAALRIRDAKTGRLLFHHDYVQKYETHVFGLIPLFGISTTDATSSSTMQAWCLAALTDRAVADATAFLSSAK